MSEETTHVKKSKWVNVFTIVQGVCLVLFLLDAVLGAQGVFQNGGAVTAIFVYLFAFIGPLMALAGLIIGNFLWLSKKAPNRNLVFVSLINLVIVFIVMFMGVTYS